jgi:cytoskeletal protein RodZ
MFDEIANELKTAREKSLMTLAQLSNKSKIDLKFLEAIEHGDFDFLPDLYVRAFVKNYARIVGLNESKISKKYEAARQGIPYIEEAPVRKEEKPKSAESQNREIRQRELAARKDEDKQISPTTQPGNNKQDKLFTFDAVGGANQAHARSAATNKRTLIVGSSLLGMITLFALIYFVFINKGTQEIVVEKPIEEVIQQSQRYVENEQTYGGVVSDDSLLLTIIAGDTSWIKVTSDKQATEEFILLPNSQKTIKARSIYNITFGNSGVIKLQLNGKPLAYSGKSGTPQSVTIDQEGVKNQENISSPR